MENLKSRQIQTKRISRPRTAAASEAPQYILCTNIKITESRLTYLMICIQRYAIDLLRALN
jgi:hypothetical protein